MGDTQRPGTGRSGEFSDGLPTYVFTSPGDLTTTDNALIPWIIGKGGAPLTTVSVQVKTAPTGTDITIDIKTYDRSTATVIATIGTVTILAGTFKANFLLSPSVLVDTTMVLAAEITQIGSIVPGANLTVQVF
jgi:hypothetical protein